MALTLTPELEQQGVNTIRALAMDAVQTAGVGHPGTAMALAPLAHVLWTRIMKYSPEHPEWFDRDRFVLSAGHASVLQYSILHLTGYRIGLDDLRRFRQWGSITPGHPERGHTAGIEVTTGPLGQGLANAVGMAMAEANLRARFGAEVCDHFTYCIAGDGCLMEGISHEAASMAGHFGLGRLVVIYDDNHITIDGPTELTLSDDAGMRFRSYGWDVDEIGEVSNDLDKLEAAILRAKSVTDKPTLIRLRSHIGYPSPNKTDTSAAHGEALGVDEVKATKTIMKMDPERTFDVSVDVASMYRTAGAQHASAVTEWEARAAAHPMKEEWEACLSGKPLAGWTNQLPVYEPGTSVATRQASGDCLNALLPHVPALMAGGADLTGNTGTLLKSATKFSSASPEGRQVHFGVREHGMGAVMNGLAAHGGSLPVGGTFFVFSDYMRGAVRVAAIQHSRVIYSWTHDSIGVGEDGPTHQPVEHLASFRAMPNLRVIRPGDANEVAAAWRVAIWAESGPTALILSRQKIPVLAGTKERANAGVERGAYILVDPTTDSPDVVLVGTGSELQHCVDAAKKLHEEGYDAMVVSMPSWDLFDDQEDEYQEQVFPPGVPVVACEAGASMGWERFADISVTMDTWGASASSDRLMEEYGFDADAVVEAALLLLEDDEL